MRFHLALPELNGLGVITLTLLFTKSAQVLIFLGFPFLTMNETIELVTIPAVGPLSQLGDTIPALTSLSISGVSEKLTTSAGRPETTDVACVPEAPNDVENVTPAPALVALKALMSAEYAGFGVE